MSSREDQPPLKIDLSFGEALTRFSQVDREELKAKLDAIPKRPRAPNKKPRKSKKSEN